MKELLVSFKTAKLAKEKGFDSWQEYHYNVDKTIYLAEDLDGRGYPAPTLSELQRLLRENKKIFVSVDIDPDIYRGLVNYHAEIKNCNPISEALGARMADGFTIHQNYELALEEGLFEALNLIK